jgi:acetyl-CoA carboxylase carboxyltransferase component
MEGLPLPPSVAYGTISGFKAEMQHFLISSRSMRDLIDVSPADGLVGGLAEVWGHPVVVAAYDYTVFAGTQGAINHKKQDRLFSLAAARSLPVVLFAEGGGGRYDGWSYWNLVEF